MPPSAENNIALTGFMAVGKSAVGRSLAKKLKWRFVDLDRAVEEAEGKKVKTIFAEKGEPYFRQREKEALARILEESHQVIATGGGAILDPENLRLLKEKSFLICLTAAVDVLLQRAGSGAKRPLLEEGDRRQRIEELLRQRSDRYAQAHACIDTGALGVHGVVKRILAMLNLEC